MSTTMLVQPIYIVATALFVFALHWMNTPATARRLVTEGLGWEPQIGAWCTVLGGEHLAEGAAGLWLVIAVLPGA